MKRVLRFSVAIDDRPHEVPAGVPVLFDRTDRNRLPGLEHLLDLWFELVLPDGWPATGYKGPTQQVQIFGTGHLIPPGASWLASFRDGPLVWHLYRIPEVGEGRG